MKFFKKKGSPAPEADADAMDRADWPQEGTLPDAPAPAPKKKFSLSFGRKPGAPANRERKAKPKGFSLSALKKNASEKAQATRKPISLSGEITTAGDGVVVIGKHKFAAGIYWAPPDDNYKPKQQVALINETNQATPGSKSPFYQLYVDPRKTGFLGLAAMDLGHAAGMHALITSISPETTAARWIGAFLINAENDIWWIGGSRDGKIYDDAMIRGASTAQEFFFTALQAPDWQAIFAPAEWGVTGSRQNGLAELIDPKLGYKVSAINPLKPHLPKIAIVVAGAVLIIGGYGAYHAKIAADLAELAEIRKKAESQVTLGPKDYPWDQVTAVGDFVKRCQEEMRRVIAPVPGWDLQPISCTISKGQGTISTGWVNAGGRIAWLRAGLPADIPAVDLSPDGKQASISFGFPAPIVADSWIQQPWTSAQSTSWLRERFQNAGLDVEIRPDPKNVSVAAAAPVFNSDDLKITTSVSLSNYGDLLADVPAFVPSALIYNVQTMNWDLVAKIYAPPILPESNKKEKKTKKKRS